MKINIRGPIISDANQWIYDWFGIPATSPSSVIRQLDDARSKNITDIIVNINSGGGSVYDGSEIYTELKGFEGNVTVQIPSIAASAASFIATAAERVEISPTAQIMIHNASSYKEGDYRDMDDASDFLQKVNKSIMNAYKIKTGKSEEELKDLMDKETFMTAQEAVELGFADVVMFENEPNAVASIEVPQLVNGILPPEVIDTMRNELAKNKSLNVINSVQVPEIDSKQEESEPKMDLEQLKNEHPDLYNQVYNLGLQDGQNAENARIKEIENLAIPGNEELVNKAKFGTKTSAEALAVEIVKAQKVAGQNYLHDRKADANHLNDVPPSGEEPSNSKHEDLSNLWG